MIEIVALDHLVLTVADIARTREFYQSVLGMAAVSFGDGRHALRYGQQKINLHQAGASFAPHAQVPTPGSADLCLLISGSLAAAEAHLQALGVPIVAGPVRRTGATETLRSIYIRDPDGNLLELSVPAAPSGDGG
ncbi:VOC family protein [Leptolyngbya sp. CCNP1308]|uniref:VOC family protein n=1 Tax=Leptolyngbya sp. CCNP1308 TaxID=3110255 RepID=UPI002B1FE6FC|nr:VOC family protein [Leptolyngbya sp. CCNP1308]MEA5452454.1 VOC family protein [Leptolyngbya sp. CCNP1308]